jgi:hypothetical protein
MAIDCTCEQEAEILYKMYKKLGHYEDCDMVTPVCCQSEPARMVIQGETLTLHYADGTVSTYTGNP